MTLKVTCTDVIQFLKGIVQSFASLAERKKITLKFKADDELILGYVDRDKLEKIVTNLLSNAFKFTPEGGNIVVDLSLRGDSRSEARETTKQSRFSEGNEIATSARWRTRNDSNRTDSIQIKVFNTGTGIPPDQLDKIFDRFYQADESYTKELAPLDRDNPENQKSFDKHYPTGQEGTGIGMALTKELVGAHHGEIRVESELNKGTTFSVWLPIEKEYFKPEEIVEGSKDVDVVVNPLSPPLVRGDERGVEIIPPAAAKQRSRASKSAPLLLIVEDNPDVTTYISSFLEKEYRIITAENGEAGWKKALEKFPDLIISDVMMPVMDGFQFCRKLKSDQRSSHIPLILLTARADMESKLEGLEFGADDYVTKPFDAKELYVRSKNLLEQRRHLREYFQREVDFHPADITVNSMDEQFMQKAVRLIEQYMDDTDFSAERFSREIGMSHQHLNRKLQALTNHSARDFIRTIRLKRAVQLLQKRSDPVTQIAYQVGFNNPSYFAECFRQQFGISPSKYMAQHSK
jgi:CheY-like chemotaxis protein